MANCYLRVIFQALVQLCLTPQHRPYICHTSKLEATYSLKALRSDFSACLMAASAPFATANPRYFLKSMNFPTPSIAICGTLESFNGQLRDELLNREISTTPDEAKVLIEQWRKEYNQVRPHSARNNRPPAPETILTMATT